MELDSYFTGSLLILTFIALSALGVFFVRRIKGIRKLTSHHEVMGYFFPLAGSIYGVLLGLVVVNSISLFETARNTVNAEATDLVSIYTLANSLPSLERETIHALCKNYAHAVIESEWNTMDKGLHHPKARIYVINLFETILKSTDRGNNLGQAFLENTQSLWKNRRERLDVSARTIPEIEWLALCVGGILVVLFSYMFVMDSLMVQLAGTTILATMIALNIFLVLLFGSPFSGDLRVSDFPFRNALETFEDIDQHTQQATAGSIQPISKVVP